MKRPLIISVVLSFCLLAGLAYYKNEAQQVSPRDITNDITINMFGTVRAEEDFSLIIDGYGIPLDWALYGAYPWTGADIANIKQNVEETHARGLKYMHHIPIEKMYSVGDQQLGDLRPDLRKFCIVTIDGEKSMTIFDGIDVYNMNINEKGWQKFIKSEMKAAIDAGADGILLDEIQGPSLHLGAESGGVFNPVDMKGFRKFLKTVYSNQELSSEFGIGNIGTFDYRKYLIQNGWRDTWLTVPWEAPLFEEFRIYIMKTTIKSEKTLINWAKKYARRKYKRTLVFLGNSSDGMGFSLPFEANLDEAWCEYPYLLYGYPPMSKIIPSAKLRVDDRWRKGVYLTQVPTNADLIARGHPPNIVKIFWAEAYATNSECNVPRFVPGSSSTGYSPDLSVLAPYFQFIDKYREYYGSNWSWKPRVAIFYPLSSHIGIPDGYAGTALALFESGIQFDVLFSGDDLMLNNTLKLAQMQEYPVIILPNALKMTDKQVDLIMGYIAGGGTILCWGGIGSENEFGRDMLDSRPPGWWDFWRLGNNRFGKGWFVNISHDALGEAYFRNRKPAKRNLMTKGITPYAPPEVTSTAPEHINFLVYADSANKRLALHMINYRYNLNKDKVKAKKNFFVTVSLPDGFSLTGKKATLYSPDLANPKSIKMEKKNATTIKLKIPTLQYYNLVVIE